LKYIAEFVDPSFQHESLFVGYLWSNPSLYQKYKTQKITELSFTKKIWYYYYDIGKMMYDSGIRECDDKTVYAFLTSRPPETNKKSLFDQYNDFGGYDTIYDVIQECLRSGSNDEYHLSEIQKYETLRKFQYESLIDTTNKVLVNKLCSLNLKQLQLYFQHKQKDAFSHVNSGDVVEHDLVDELDETIAELNEGQQMGTPLHDAPRLSRKVKGWKDGALYYLILSSGVGKSSLAMEKFILSCFENNEKAMLAINEESVKKWRTLLLATIASKILKKPINREKLFEGKFTQDILDKLNSAKQWARDKGQGLIKVIESKKWRIADILNRIELYRPKGYRKLIIDTFKPDRSQGDLARWEAFSNSAQELHDIIKEDNYNVGTLATVQLKIGKEFRYLDLDSIGKSTEIVEVAAVVMIGRLIFDDEYPKQKNELHPYNYKKDEFNGKWNTEPYELNPDKEYLILFLSKNRFGGEDEQIVFEVNYDINSFREVAFVRVPRLAKANV
jgi:replicative DNA helicase